MMQLDFKYDDGRYSVKETQDANGDIVEREFYRSYDDQTDSYEGLVVKEILSVTRDSVFGLPQSQAITIELIKGGSVNTSKTYNKHFNGDEASDFNRQSRKRLVNKAQGYLLQEIGLEKTKQIARELSGELSEYERSDRGPLVAAINASTNPDLTPTRKAVLLSILDRAYT